MTTIRCLTATLLLFTLAACQHYYPMGMNEHEWSNLTPVERAEMRVQQSILDAAEDAARAEREAKEQARIDKLYADAKPGDVIQCVIEGGFGLFGEDALPYRPLAFRLARGENRYVEVQENPNSYNRHDVWVSFRRDGLALDVCPVRSTGHTTDCFSAVAIAQDLAKGKSWQLDMETKFYGATLRCGLPLGQEPSDIAQPSA